MEETEFIRSVLEDIHGAESEMPTIDIESLVGRTFITLPDENY